MFDWYHDAELCLAYLIDVNTNNKLTTFERSEWFKRGWTLQELLAPRMVVFLTKEWDVIGHKGHSAHGDHPHLTGPGIEQAIARITGINE